ncbi:amidase, partial [Staphylococcus aureus]
QASKKETAKPQPKAVELKIIKDVVKGYDLPKRGGNPKGVNNSEFFINMI